MTRIKLIPLTLFCFAIVISNTRCDKKVALKPPVDPTVVDCKLVTYSKDIKPIIDAVCVSCHITGGTGSGDFTTYDGVKSKASAGSLKTRLYDTPSNPMPPPPATLSAVQLNTIKCWLDAGAPNN